VAHADFRAVEQHLVERRNDGRNDFTLLPHRSIDKASMIGVAASALARDVAYSIAAFKKLSIKGDAAYEEALRAAVDRWLKPPNRGDAD
jgi:hypothetical protein